MTFIFSIGAVLLIDPVLRDRTHRQRRCRPTGAPRRLLRPDQCPRMHRDRGGPVSGHPPEEPCRVYRLRDHPGLRGRRHCHRRRSLMAVVTLRQAGPASATNASALAVGQGLVAVRDMTFLVGPGLMPGLNALLLGYVLYHSGLVPRVIPAMGLVGAPLFLFSLPHDSRPERPGLPLSGLALPLIFSGSCRSGSGSPSRASGQRPWLPLLPTWVMPARPRTPHRHLRSPRPRAWHRPVSGAKATVSSARALAADTG